MAVVQQENESNVPPEIDYQELNLHIDVCVRTHQLWT